MGMNAPMIACRNSWRGWVAMNQNIVRLRYAPGSARWQRKCRTGGRLIYRILYYMVLHIWLRCDHTHTPIAAISITWVSENWHTLHDAIRTTFVLRIDLIFQIETRRLICCLLLWEGGGEISDYELWLSVCIIYSFAKQLVLVLGVILNRVNTFVCAWVLGLCCVNSCVWWLCLIVCVA